MLGVSGKLIWGSVLCRFRLCVNAEGVRKADLGVSFVQVQALCEC